MKRQITFAVFLLISVVLAASFGSSPVLCQVQGVDMKWDFVLPHSKMGWTANEDVADFTQKAGMLCGTGKGSDPQVTSPEFKLTATNDQVIQLLLIADKDGPWQVYWANTTEEPYSGFRPEKVLNFRVIGDNKPHIYNLTPFWKKDGQVIKLRIDPPDGTKFRIDYVRIIDLPQQISEPGGTWNFFDGRGTWTAVRGIDDKGIAGVNWSMASELDSLILSPKVSFDAAKNGWVTVRMEVSSGSTASLAWVTDQDNGAQTVTFPVIADSQVHTYNIETRTNDKWQGSIVRLGLTPSDEKAEVQLRMVAIGNTRQGPPEMVVKSFTTEDAMIRAGTDAKLKAVILNNGGETARGLSIVLNLPKNVELKAGQLAQTAKDLDPGKETTVEWTIFSKGLGETPVDIEVSATGAPSTRSRAKIKWAEPVKKADLGAGGYVPRPNPVSTGDYLVGAYYFPGWDKYDKWAVLDDFPERRPVMGYYREGDPEIADWHIKWALEHGISFFVYDWYWSQGGRSLEHALHKGFFNAKYRNMFKFCLLWANHNPPNTSSEQDCLNVTRYWIENYFKRPEYLKIDGKPVVVIFSAGRLTEDMRKDGVKAAFEKMRKLCRDNGLPGIYLVACTYPGTDYIKTLCYEGYDGLSGYNYPGAGAEGELHAPYDTMVTGYADYWKAIDKDSSVPYVPVTEPGWDSRPWHGSGARVRTGKDPAKFAKMLQNAKAFEDTPNRRLLGGKKIVLVEAWNEWGEGDYIEPHREWGFGYLDAIRKVFGQNAGPHTDLIPTDVGLGPYELRKPEPKLAWDFSKPGDAEGWYVQWINDFGVKDGKLCGTASSRDPGFYSPGTKIDADTRKTIEIRMKQDKGTEAQLFWAPPRQRLSEARSVKFAVVPDGQFHDYTLDLKDNAAWAGEIRQFRLDPCAVDGVKTEIEYFRVK